MGFNSVAVIYNDNFAQAADDPLAGKRMVDAWREIGWGHSPPGIEGWFGYGQFICQSHADYDQIVVVGQNRGRRIQEVNDLSAFGQVVIAECLQRHGWSVKRPKKAKVA